MNNTIKKALNNNKLVYVKFVSGIYQGQIASIKSMQQLDRTIESGNIELYKITNTQDTLKQMITKAY